MTLAPVNAIRQFLVEIALCITASGIWSTTFLMNCEIPSAQASHVINRTPFRVLHRR